MELNEIPLEQKCCFNCKYFEERTGFCRKNPPQVQFIRVAETNIPSAMFPKIQVPSLDYCSYFENCYEKEMI